MKLDVTYMSSRTENYLVGEGTVKILGGEHFLFSLKKKKKKRVSETTKKKITNNPPLVHRTYPYESVKGLLVILCCCLALQMVA